MYSLENGNYAGSDYSWWGHYKGISNDTVGRTSGQDGETVEQQPTLIHVCRIDTPRLRCRAHALCEAEVNCAVQGQHTVTQGQQCANTSQKMRSKSQSLDNIIIKK